MSNARINAFRIETVRDDGARAVTTYRFDTDDKTGRSKKLARLDALRGLRAWQDYFGDVQLRVIEVLV